MAREEPALVFEGVAEGNVGHVVQQRRDPDRGLGVAIDRVPRAPDRVDQAMRHEAGSERVLEAGVHRARVDQIGRAELLDAAHALHGGGVEHGGLDRGKVDVAVQCVANEHCFRGSGFGEGIRLPNPDPRNYPRIPAAAETSWRLASALGRAPTRLNHA